MVNVLQCYVSSELMYHHNLGPVEFVYLILFTWHKHLWHCLEEYMETIYFHELSKIAVYVNNLTYFISFDKNNLYITNWICFYNTST